MAYKIRDLKLISRNLTWLKGGQSTRDKLSYYPSFVASYLRMILLRDKSIKYLGNKLEFDNIITPFSIVCYPEEINNKILKNTTGKIKNVLDIGGNLGQFSITFARLHKNAQIDVFEPNPIIFKMLKRNASNLSKLRLFNYGIADGKTTQEMYFEPGRSGIGSFVKENAGNKEKLKKITIKTTNDIPAITKRGRYDLIKIDVEGFEYEVLKRLTNLKTKYLFIEVSSQGRTKSYEHSEMMEIIKKNFGEFDIVHTTPVNSSSPTFDMLLQFKNF